MATETSVPVLLPAVVRRALPLRRRLLLRLPAVPLPLALSLALTLSLPLVVALLRDVGAVRLLLRREARGVVGAVSGVVAALPSRCWGTQTPPGGVSV